MLLLLLLLVLLLDLISLTRAFTQPYPFIVIILNYRRIIIHRIGDILHVQCSLKNKSIFFFKT